ncbi:hypothetical protein GGR60_001252 [Xanthomonas arboricola]|nr:hypothetical protein [Xanthomonas euroxanthea]
MLRGVTLQCYGTPRLAMRATCTETAAGMFYTRAFGMVYADADDPLVCSLLVPHSEVALQCVATGSIRGLHAGSLCMPACRYATA